MADLPLRLLGDEAKRRDADEAEDLHTLWTYEYDAGRQRVYLAEAENVQGIKEGRRA